MEDPDHTEWEIQEYPSSKDETTMMRWILNKGYGIGKKVAITGIAISSAPLVLPPLVVFSAIGVAFSVPFGLVFASYACTNKLMSKLLPTPPASSLMLEYYADEDEEEVEGWEEGEYMADIKQGVECRYETDEGDYGDVDEQGYDEDDKLKSDLSNGKEGEDDLRREIPIEGEEKKQMEDIKQGVQMRLKLDAAADELRRTDEGSLTNFHCNVDEEGYEEDAAEYVEGDDDSFEEEKGGEKPLIEVQQVVVLVEENKRNLSEVHGLDVVAGAMEGDSRKVEEVREDEEREIARGSTGLLEKIRDEGKINNAAADDFFLGDNGSHGVSEEIKDVEPTEPLIVEVVDSQRLVDDVNKNGKTANEYEDALLRTKKEHSIHSNADAREIGDECGLDLFDDRDEATYQSISMNLESPEADHEAKENVAVDNVDVLLDSEYANVASKADMKVPSARFSDEGKVSEQIEAMRAIVGYRGPRQAACMEELKALYVFTGIAPPASIKGCSDLDEVNAMLKFLMSIVGVK